MVGINDTIPASVAIEMRVVPLRELAGTLIIATDAQVLHETLERLSFILNRKVRFVVRSYDWMEAELDCRYRCSPELSGTTTENDTVSWFWPSWHYFDGDKLIVKASGWEGMSRWTGVQEFALDHPDRAFWNWLVKVPQYREMLDQREIPRIKRIWYRYCKRVMRARNNPKRDFGRDFPGAPPTPSS